MKSMIIAIAACLAVLAGGQPATAEYTAKRSLHTTPTGTVTERAGFIEETVLRTVWVPGSFQAVWIPPRIETYTDDAGVQRQKLIQAGHYLSQWVPGRIEAIPVVRRYRLPRYAVQTRANRESYGMSTRHVVAASRTRSNWLY